MDVRIGISNSVREITFETDLTAEEVIQQIETATDDGQRYVKFSDSKNSEWYITVANINFVEFVSKAGRKVGFVN